MSRAASARPFLKWVGGKGQLLAQMQPMLPPKYGRYFEPFVGGAALFFHLRPSRATLTDVNPELVDCYVAVQKHVEDVIRALQQHEHDETHFYAVRAQDRSTLSLAERAARTIYLNKTGYNGLYRVNRAGRFNVPFGRYDNPGYRQPEALANLRACARALKGVDIRVRDFGDVAGHARKGDFVYFDPPYVPVSSTSDFTSYIPGGFGLAEQERLADVFARLAKKGVHVVLSNSDTPAVRELYGRFRIDRVLAMRSVNSKVSGRGKVGEVVVRSF